MKGTSFYIFVSVNLFGGGGEGVGRDHRKMILGCCYFFHYSISHGSADDCYPCRLRIAVHVTCPGASQTGFFLLMLLTHGTDLQSDLAPLQ